MITNPEVDKAIEEARKRWGPLASAHMLSRGGSSIFNKDWPSDFYYSVGCKTECTHCDGTGELEVAHGDSFESFEEAFKQADK